VSRKTAAQTYCKRRTTTNRRDGLLFSEARALKSLLSSNGMAPCWLVAIVLCLTMTQRRHQRGEGGMGPAACRKIATPPFLGRLHGNAYYLSFVCISCWNGRINQLYSSKNFDSSINKEEKKNTKKKDTHSQHTETGIQTYKQHKL